MLFLITIVLSWRVSTIVQSHAQHTSLFFSADEVAVTALRCQSFVSSGVLFTTTVVHLSEMTYSDFTAITSAAIKHTAVIPKSDLVVPLQLGQHCYGFTSSTGALGYTTSVFQPEAVHTLFSKFLTGWLCRPRARPKGSMQFWTLITKLCLFAWESVVSFAKEPTPIYEPFFFFLILAAV